MPRGIGDGVKANLAVQHNRRLLHRLASNGIDYRSFDGRFSGLLRWRKRWPPIRGELHLSGHAEPQQRNKHHRELHCGTPGGRPLVDDAGATAADGGTVGIRESSWEVFGPSRRVTATPELSNGLRKSGS